MKTLLERFEEKYVPEPNSGCWLWTAYCNEDGYGKMGHLGKIKFSHRISYELFLGPIPDGFKVLHRCDTPPCVNPLHLFLGKDMDNWRDCVAKGRNKHPVGIECHKAKINGEDVKYIRKSRKHYTELMAEFGLSQSSIHRIKSRWSWKHVE